MNMDEKKNLKEKSKLGHRRVTDEGTVTYKRKTTSEIQQAIQIGIRTTVLSAHNKAKRDMLLKDFGVIETLAFPKAGSKDTLPHSLSDFKFKTFAPIAFRYFRDFFEVDIEDYLNSICNKELHELVNAGASGSIFYITMDDEFIIKTVQHKEASFLQKLLPEYYINLMQHPRTLLPKFYGLYCYQTMGKNIRFVIMNNLLPSIKIHEKYDLKGSTYKRIAGVAEKSKASPTLKDLDFRENHPDGLVLEVETYEALLNTIQRDCRVLESFRIMDYSLLLGIHNLDVDSEGLRKKSESNEKKHFSEPLTKDMSVFDDVHFRENGDEQSYEKSDDVIVVTEKSDGTEDNDDSVAPGKHRKQQTDSKTSTSVYYTPSAVEVEKSTQIKFLDVTTDEQEDLDTELPGQKLMKEFELSEPTDDKLVEYVVELKTDAVNKVSTKYYGFRTPLRKIMRVNPSSIVKKVEKCVEGIIRKSWLECDRQLYSSEPPLAILSSGSSDLTSHTSDTDVASITTEAASHSGRQDKCLTSNTSNCELSISLDSSTVTNHNSNNCNQQPVATSSTNQNNATNVVIRRPLNRQTSKNKSIRRIAAYSTVLESIQAPVELFDIQDENTENIPAGGIPARNKMGDRLILFMGIIDILQSYRLTKRLEHNMKAIFLDAETISVTNPNFYGLRFQEFFGNVVFKKIPSPMRHQQPEKKLIIIPKVVSTSAESTDDVVNPEIPGVGSDETTISATDGNEEVKSKTHVTFPQLNSSE